VWEKLGHLTSDISEDMQSGLRLGLWKCSSRQREKGGFRLAPGPGHGHLLHAASERGEKGGFRGRQKGGARNRLGGGGGAPTSAERRFPSYGEVIFFLICECE
jgi:hypothetical protein